MLLSKKEVELMNILHGEVNKVIELVSNREAIHRKSEGRISISFPGIFEGSSVTVTLDSYLMSDFDIKTSWTNATLEKALLKAINDVRLWKVLEKDSVPSNFDVDKM